ncbi:MAG: hypothetical protein KGI92_02115 [Alphaproteobacteria bacterium]|nr:hypothetical protein [Alphaproteobacteria bacterium]
MRLRFVFVVRHVGIDVGDGRHNMVNAVDLGAAVADLPRLYHVTGP